MNPLKYDRVGVVQAPRPGREAALLFAALALRGASAALARLSRRLARPARHASRPAPQLTFHVEPGALDGALYLDGEFVGWVPGVRRL